MYVAVAVASLSAPARAAEVYSEPFEAGTLGCWQMNTADTVVSWIPSGAPSGAYLASDRVPGGTLALGTVCEEAAVVDLLRGPSQREVRFEVLIAAGNVQELAVRIRYLDFFHNGWHHPLPIPAPGTWESRAVTFDPLWSDLDATANGWAQEPGSPSFAATMASPYTLEIRAEGPGEPMSLGVDSLWVGPFGCMDADLDLWCATSDCDELDPGTHPEALEVADGRDQNCDGTVDEGTLWFDDDGDGSAESGGDCDDADVDIGPGALESCDAVDEDCDGRIDEDTPCSDDDGDGWCEAACTDGTSPGDCADADPAVWPGAPELENGVDDDCDGSPESVDLDRDGYPDDVDCDDDRPEANPGAVETPNGLDDDCDDQVDEGTELADDDGDGFSEAEGDCDDAIAEVYPGATETLNGRDDDCDLEIDEPTHADTEGPRSDDLDSDGWTVAEGDCDDGDDWSNPAQVEFCDGSDNDCDGAVDDGCTEPSKGDAAVSPAGCTHTAALAPGATAAAGSLLAAFASRRRRRRCASAHPCAAKSA